MITSMSVVVRATSHVGSVRLTIKRGSRKFPFIRARQLEPVLVGLATMHARMVARIQADIKHRVEVSLIRAVSWLPFQWRRVKGLGVSTELAWIPFIIVMRARPGFLRSPSSALLLFFFIACAPLCAALPPSCPPSRPDKRAARSAATLFRFPRDLYKRQTHASGTFRLKRNTLLSFCKENRKWV